MLKQLFSDNRIFIAAVCLLVFVAGGLLYLQTVKQEANREVQRTQEMLQQKQLPKIQTEAKPPPPGETAESGHWHGDVWHAEPHETHAPAPQQKTDVAAEPAPPPPKSAESSETLPQLLPPERDPDFVNPTSTSSNPLFSEGVPEHLQCPPEFIDVYRSEDLENLRQRIPRAIYEEIKEKWNPNRPLTKVWPVFIEQEKWYRANADPQKAEFFGAAGRIDWLVQHWLDYPEITVLLDEDAPRASDMLRVEIGVFRPDWNAFTLPEGSGRTFRKDVDKKYVFTWSRSRENEDGGFTSRTRTYTTGPSNGDPNAEVIEIDLDTISDDELERLGGWNYNINPYTTGAYKLGDNR